MGTGQRQRSRLARVLHTLLPLGLCLATPWAAALLVPEPDPDDYDVRPSDDGWWEVITRLLLQTQLTGEFVFLVVAGVGFALSRRLLGPRSPRPVYALGRTDVLLLLAGAAALSALIHLIRFVHGGMTPTLGGSAYFFSEMPFLGAVALTCILVVIAPATEELLYRGYLQGELQRFWGPVVSIGIASALFALMHGHFARVVSLLPGAIVLGTFTWLTGSIVASLLLHGGMNATPIVLQWLPLVDSAVVATLLLVLMLLGGGYALVLALLRVQAWRRSIRPDPSDAPA